MTSPPATTLVFLHSLGSSRREWDGVIEKLTPEANAIAIDMAGFGDCAGEGYFDVEGALDRLCRQLVELDLTRWVIVGHSMGGKFATLVAARARDGSPGLSGLLGVVLVAASPPGPEPMDEGRRTEMLTWFDDPARIGDRAELFIDGNTADGLAPPLHRQAVDDFARTSPEAWRGWLAEGSREDWSDQAGVICLPALVIAGAEDGDLGEAAQRRCNAPHFRTAEIMVVPDAAHMMPQEQPDRLAGLIRGFVVAATASALPAPFVRLLGSDRVSGRTRRAIMRRHFGDAEPHGDIFSPDQRGLLAAVVARILPGAVEPWDMVRRLENALATSRGDGWRFADLPSDAEAWRRGLDTLSAMSPDFLVLDPEGQDSVLRAVAQGEPDGSEQPGRLSAHAMGLWFEDLVSETARAWMALPSTWAEIGYDGFATGGDDRIQGYRRLEADVSEPWRLGREGLD